MLNLRFYVILNFLRNFCDSSNFRKIWATVLKLYKNISIEKIRYWIWPKSIKSFKCFVILNFLKVCFKFACSLKKNRNVNFSSVKIDLSICPNIYRFFSDFFLILEIFFLVLKKRSKVTKFGHAFEKRLRTILKKFLDNWSKRFENTTPTFFDKRNFQNLKKNLKKNC